MQCVEFELALQRQLDGESVEIDHDLLREHAVNCDPCRELQEGTKLLIGYLESAQVPPVPTGLADRICAASSRSSARFRFKFRVRPTGWLVAAAVAGAIALSIRWLNLPEQSTATLAARSITPEQPAAREELFPELTGPGASDQRDSVPIMVAVEPVSRLFQAVGKSLGDPVRPIAVSTSEAMSNLIRDLPDTDVPAIPIPIMRDMMGMPPAKKMPSMVPSS